MVFWNQRLISREESRQNSVSCFLRTFKRLITQSWSQSAILTNHCKTQWHVAKKLFIFHSCLCRWAEVWLMSPGLGCRLHVSFGCLYGTNGPMWTTSELCRCARGHVQLLMQISIFVVRLSLLMFHWPKQIIWRSPKLRGLEVLYLP